MQFVKISSSYTKSRLPAQFSNQIYFSENSALNDITYRSSYSLKYVMSGYEGYKVEGREKIIHPGQHLLINDDSEVTTLSAFGKALSIFIAPETLLDVFTIVSARSLRQNLDKVTSIENPPVFRSGIYQTENRNTRQLLTSLGQHLTSQDVEGRYEIDPSLFFHLSEAIICDQQEHTARLSRLQGPKAATIQEQYERLLLGYEYLRDHWNAAFSLQETAAVALLSPYHFHRLFTRCFSMTPYQFHLGIQMNYARDVLHQKDRSVAEVAQSLGFNHANTFRRAFKKFYGVLPSRIRQAGRKTEQKETSN